MLARGILLAGRFEIEREAGSGGFGTVYRAFDRRDERAVAVKVLHEARREAADAARFAREAPVTASRPSVTPLTPSDATQASMPLASQSA